MMPERIQVVGIVSHLLPIEMKTDQSQGSPSGSCPWPSALSWKTGQLWLDHFPDVEWVGSVALLVKLTGRVTMGEEDGSLDLTMVKGVQRAFVKVKVRGAEWKEA